MGAPRAGHIRSRTVGFAKFVQEVASVGGVPCDVARPLAHVLVVYAPPDRETRDAWRVAREALRALRLVLGQSSVERAIEEDINRLLAWDLLTGPRVRGHSDPRIKRALASLTDPAETPLTGLRRRPGRTEAERRSTLCGHAFALLTHGPSPLSQGDAASVLHAVLLLLGYTHASEPSLRRMIRRAHPERFHASVESAVAAAAARSNTATVRVPVRADFASRGG